MKKAIRITAAVAGGLVLVAGVFLALAWFDCGFRGCPDLDRLRGYTPEEASFVVSRGGVDLAKLYRVQRIVVPIDSLPEYVPAAFIAIEDEDFREHHGIDWGRMLAAAWANLRAGRIEQGFSTITMQLARNVFSQKLPPHEQTLSRKLGEMRVAWMIEDRYTKDEILGMYVNQIYYGAGAWGIEAASREYFGKSAAELTLAEAATLAALPRSPSRLNPRVNPDFAKRRRNLVLAQMADQRLVSTDRAREAMNSPLALGESSLAEEQARAPYFVEAVRRRLEKEFGPTLYTGGYRIHTTLDVNAQRTAEEELARQLDAIEAGRYGRFPHAATYPDRRGGSGAGRTNYLQGAVVVMNARTGDVRAMVGGRDYRDSEFNRATQADRQPGSAFKPIVYATALNAGYPLTLRLRDEPIRVRLENGDVWTPVNYGGGYMGMLTMRQALVHSRNVPTVRLAVRVGIDSIIEMAHELGIGGGIPRVPSIALGASQVSLLELATAYATLATLGRRPQPRLVTRVEDAEGNVVWRNPPRASPALDPAVAFLLTTVLQDVVNRGTATAVRAAGYRGVAAGKTGTTNDATNVWFVGYTPQQVTGVWIGFDRPQPILPGATGGQLAAPVWGGIMRRIGRGSDRAWRPPPGVERHPVGPGGRPLGRDCPTLEGMAAEYFLEGTVPADQCRGWAAPPDGLLGEPVDTPGPGGQMLRDWLRRRRARPDSARHGLPPGPPVPSPDAPDDTTDESEPGIRIEPPADTGRGGPDLRRGQSEGDPGADGDEDAGGEDEEIDLLGRPANSAPPDTSGVG